MNRFFLLGRLLQFRNELVMLWRGFFDARTPLYLKAAMLGLLAYLISPFDIVPDFLPVLGIVDDVVLIGFAVHWIANRLPEGVRNPRPARVRASADKTIDGTARRL